MSALTRPRPLIVAAAAIALGGTLWALPALARDNGIAAERTPAGAWLPLLGAPSPAAPGDELIVLLRGRAAADRRAPRAGNGAVAAATRTQQAELAALRGAGIQLAVEERFVRLVDAVAARVPASQLAQLSAAPQVAGIYPVRALRQAGDVSAGQAAAVAISGRGGAGVPVALLDGPVDLSALPLAGRATGPAEGRSTRPVAAHGTADAAALIGAAPGARVSIVPILHAQPGSGVLGGTTIDLLRGLETAADPNHDGRLADRARIVVTTATAPWDSFGDAPEERAVAALSRLGALVVAAAGDDGASAGAAGPVGAPASAPAALAVGALDTRLSIARVPLAFDGASTTGPVDGGLVGALAPATSGDAALGLPGQSRGGVEITPVSAGGLLPAVEQALRDGARALIVHAPGGVAAGVLGGDARAGIPVIAVDDALGRTLEADIADGRSPRVRFGSVERTWNPDAGLPAAFSSSGLSLAGDSRPDVLAPGVGIAATGPGGAAVAATGSSIAAAQAGGVAATLVARHRGWSVAQLRAALMAGRGVGIVANPAAIPLPDVAPVPTPLRAIRWARLERAAEGTVQLVFAVGRAVQRDGSLDVTALRDLRIEMPVATGSPVVLWSAHDLLPGTYRFDVSARTPEGRRLLAGGARVAFAATDLSGVRLRSRLSLPRPLQ